ncbi:MAG: tRNA pseudouridine(38-40) synthase TruA [Fidelibacterota bacterium]
MGRFKITIQYDGSRYYGWQLQKKARTIQGTLEEALAIISGGNQIRIYGAGRTDTGVHALGQVAHFDLETTLSAATLIEALNGNLPDDIQVSACESVSDQFHARHSAVTRTYNYRCRTDEFILDRSFTWLTGPLNIEMLNLAAEKITGDHDFSSFSRHSESLNHRRCIVSESAWKADGDIVNYTIVGNRFLHHMVRYLVGTMVEISRGRFSLTDFVELIKNPKERVHIFKAPPQGLILKQVEYRENVSI